MSLVHSASLISFKVGVGIRWCLGLDPEGKVYAKVVCLWNLKCWHQNTGLHYKSEEQIWVWKILCERKRNG